jgi:hypothetical protein
MVGQKEKNMFQGGKSEYKDLFIFLALLRFGLNQYKKEFFF